VSAVRRQRMGRALAAAAIVALAVSVVTCAPAASPSASAPAVPTSAPVPGGPAVRRPGLERPASGPAVAYGWVVHETIEGGFWALVDGPPSPASAEQPKVVVVLLAGRVPEAEIARLEGSFARASGKVSDGVSVRMAGPEMKVDTIAGSRDQVPK
jgi:hypothetical protein